MLVLMERPRISFQAFATIAVSRPFFQKDVFHYLLKFLGNFFFSAVFFEVKYGSNKSCSEANPPRAMVDVTAKQQQVKALAGRQSSCDVLRMTLPMTPSIILRFA